LDSISDSHSAQDKVFGELVQAGRVSVISWLGISRKPSGQILDRLRRLNYPSDVIDAVMISLQEDGYIDDRRLAQKIVRQRQGRQSESRAALEQRMLRQGIAAEAIPPALPDESDDYNAAIQLLHSRFSVQLSQLSSFSSSDSKPLSDHTVRLDSRMLWMKAGRFLASRGFSASVIRRALTEVLPGIDSTGDDQA